MKKLDQDYWKKMATALKTLDREARIRTLVELSTKSEMQAVRLVLQALRNDDLIVRDRAAALLSQMPQPQIITGLISMLDVEDKEVKKVVIETLRAIPFDRFFKMVFPVIAGPDIDSHLLRELIPLLNRNDPEEQKLIKEKFTDKQVHQLLNHPDETVRKRAFEWAALSMPDTAADVSVKYIKLRDKEVQASAIKVLKNVSEKTLFSLVENYFPGSHPALAEVLSYRISLIDTPQSRQYLVMALRDPDNAIKRAVIRGITYAGSSYAIDILTEAAKDKPLQETVIKALGSVTGENSIRGLISLMRNSRCYDSARAALLNMDTAVLEKVLIKIATEKNDTEGEYAISLLGRINSGSALDMILQFPMEHPFISIAQRAYGEIRLRSALEKNKLDTSKMELVEIEESAVKRGWESGEKPLPLLLIDYGRNQQLSAQESRLRRELEQAKSSVTRTEAEILFIQETPKSTGSYIQFVYLFLLVISLFGGIYCFYRNWIAYDVDYWYSGVVFFTLLGGLAFYLLLRLARKKQPALKTSQPVSIKNTDDLKNTQEIELDRQTQIQFELDSILKEMSSQNEIRDKLKKLVQLLAAR